MRKAIPTPLEPVSGQESVWDYPRPPRVELTNKHLEVVFNGIKIADSIAALRVLETGSPPVYYIPLEDIRMQYLMPDSYVTLCEWKGGASYYDIQIAELEVPRAAWTYKKPTPPYQKLAGHIAFYASKMDTCRVDGEVVHPQAGDFYGGWITSDIIGPFKGEEGTGHW